MSLDPAIALLVLFAALLHATWNALVKVDSDRLVVLAVMCMSGGLFGLALLPVAPALPEEAWLWVAASAVLHHVYYFCLLSAYRHGDLSHVYPVARGLGPFVVALASGPVAGEVIGAGAMAGVALVSFGLGMLAWTANNSCQRGWHPNVFAVLTGLMIATYTLVDGMGARVGGSALAYVAWLNILEAPFVPLLALALRRGQIAPYLARHWWRGGVAGIVAALGYGIVIWAMTLAPLAHVAALRETSVIFAAIIGALVLRESFGPPRVAAAALVAAGIITMRFAG